MTTTTTATIVKKISEGTIDALQRMLNGIQVSQLSLRCKVLLAGSLTVVLGAIAAFRHHLNLSSRGENEPPVLWSWIPILGNAIEMGQRPLRLMQ